MFRETIDLFARGVRNPLDVPSYIADRFRSSSLSAYGHLYKHYRRLPAQEEYIYDFLSNNDEFVLVVLDACRYDYFAEQISAHLDGSVRRTWSPGSLTPEWGPNVWSNQYPVTLISSNPIIGDFEYAPRNNNFGYSTYCAADHVETFVDAYNIAWDHESRTVLPDDLTDIALGEAARDGPTRLVVHYMQPHLPFIGDHGFSAYLPDYQKSHSDVSYSETEKARFLEENSTITLEEKRTYDITWGEELEYNLSVSNSGERGYTPLLEAGIKDRTDIQAGYRGNLDAALEAITRLVRRVDCPVVITADHGEFLGEYGLYDHPPISHPILRVVPWFNVDARMIGVKENTQAPIERSDRDSTADSTEKRLRDLGYL